MLQCEAQVALIDLLAEVYSKVPWGKMRTSKNPYDIFNHRVRCAASRGTVDAFISSLCNHFGLQSLPSRVVSVIETLKPYEQSVLNALSNEHVAWCMRGIVKSKQKKESAKEIKKNDKKV